jgi:hypothetical protein
VRKLSTDCVAGWAPVVRIAAMNCAEQSCDKYQVRWWQNIGIRDGKLMKTGELMKDLGSWGGMRGLG